MRFFFKKISSKLQFTSPQEQAIPYAGVPFASAKTTSGSTKSATTSTFSLPYDAPSPNQIDMETETIELNEQNITSLPKDIRIEVEGGDTHTPPEFEVAK